jgi:hypothetical protein
LGLNAVEQLSGAIGAELATNQDLTLGDHQLKLSAAR